MKAKPISQKEARRLQKQVAELRAENNIHLLALKQSTKLDEERDAEMQRLRDRLRDINLGLFKGIPLVKFDGSVPVSGGSGGDATIEEMLAAVAAAHHLGFIVTVEPRRESHHIFGSTFIEPPRRATGFTFMAHKQVAR